MKRSIVLLIFTCITTSLMALGGEFAYLYKDSRIMGMGGANIAVGGYSTSLFSNPSGLASIQKDEGFVVEVLGLGLTGSNNILEFTQEVTKLGNSTTDEKLAMVTKYNGRHFQIDSSNYSSISKNSDLFVWSAGLLSAMDLNFEAHSNLNGAAGILDTSSRVYNTLLLGAAKEYKTEAGLVDIGVTVKYIWQKSYEGTFTATDLKDLASFTDPRKVFSNSSLSKMIRKDFEKDSSGFGIDLGVNYHPFQNSILHPSFGLSMMNMGSMGMDNNYGKQPFTVNIGAAIQPEVSYIDRLVLAVDYVDIFNANSIRTYTYSADNAISFTDDTDSDIMKRLRLGAGIGLINSHFFSTQVNLGMYQSDYTAGLDITILVLKLNLATYKEEIGTGSVTIPDRRYIVQLGIGW